MDSGKISGRAIAALFLAQMVIGYLVNFELHAPLHDFLENAAPQAGLLAVNVLLSLAASLMSAGAAAFAYPTIRACNPSLAIWLVAIGTLAAALSGGEQVGAMSMLSLSEAFHQAGPDARATFEGLRVIVASVRNWSHFLGVILSGAFLLSFHATLFRYALVPRLIAAFGVIAAGLQMVTVGRTLFGEEVIFPLLAPLGLAQLILVIWLAAKGLKTKSAN